MRLGAHNLLEFEDSILQQPIGEIFLRVCVLVKSKSKRRAFILLRHYILIFLANNAEVA